MGQFAIRSALLLGAGRVIAMDDSEARLKMAKESGALTLDFKEVNVVDLLPEMTGGLVYHLAKNVPHGTDPHDEVCEAAPALVDAPKMYAEFAKRGKVVKTVLDPFATPNQVDREGSLGTGAAGEPLVVVAPLAIVTGTAAGNSIQRPTTA